MTTDMHIHVQHKLSYYFVAECAWNYREEYADRIDFKYSCVMLFTSVDLWSAHFGWVIGLRQSSPNDFAELVYMDIFRVRVSKRKYTFHIFVYCYVMKYCYTSYIQMKILSMLIE
jgi:hypothetical protein